ncbi:MAG: hypothetical protein M3Q85_11545 [Acidobacteriota bacterium]|nr:hypothetical protein [Acidobacteriota bacterium]
MPVSARAMVLAVVMIALCGAGACAGGILGKQYEYEEDLYLALDGSATVVVNASVPALVALRGIDLDLAATTRVDVGKIRAAYSSPVAEVTRVSPPWRRAGRRFVQIRLDVKDIRRLSEAGPFSWSHYGLAAQNGRHVYRQSVGASALRPGTLRNVGWKGSEVVAFRLHLPSRILWHNARELESGEPRGTSRGNILSWEQHLADRLAGTPVAIEVQMDSQSILHRTLWLFGGAFLAAVTVLALLIWFTFRKGAGPATPTTTS